MVLAMEVSISQFFPFNHGSKDPEMREVMSQCEKTADGKELNVAQLETLVKQFQFRIDWYKNDNRAGNVKKTLVNLPIKWTPEYRAHMASHAAKDPAFAPLREWMKNQMRASKTTNLSDFEKLHPGAPKGAADPKAAPKSAPSAKGAAKPAGHVPSKATAKPKVIHPPQAAPKPQADGRPKDSPTSFAKAVLQRLEPPVNIYFVRPSGKQSYYLAINPADADKESLDKNSGEFTEYLDWYYTEKKGDDHDDDDEEAGHPEETDKERECKKFFTNEYGFDNFLLCKVNHDPAEWPDEEKIDTELHDYLVTKTMIHDYIEVAVNQYRDNGNPGMTNALIDARGAFLDTHMQSEYLKYQKQRREEAEAKARADELRAQKKQFLDTFNAQTTPEQIAKRHADFIKLREAKVFDEERYFDLVNTQIRTIKDMAGVEGDQVLHMTILTRHEMQEQLKPFTSFCPGFTQGSIDAYLKVRDENIELCSSVGKSAFNQQFERDKGMSLKDYIETSEAPGIWRRFKDQYQDYLDLKKEMDKKAANATELQKRLSELEAAGGNARKRSARKTPSRSPSRSPSPSRDGTGMLPPSGRGSPGAKARRSSMLAGINTSNQVDGTRGRTPNKRYHAGAASRNGSPKPRPLA